MRTTLSLPEDCRETLRLIAESRGERGVSRVVEDAVAFYLAERSKPVVTATEAPPPLGRWQRLGADLDRQLGEDPGVIAILRSLVRGGLRRLPFSH